MAANDKQLVFWFDVRKGMLTYSMYGSRNGTDGTADCSGSITQAIKDAGGKPYAYLYSTVTLEPYLKENSYERIAVNQEWNAQAGDIVMMSWGRSMADSAGAGGHVGTMKNSQDFISVDYWTGGQQGTAVSEHNIDHYLATNQPSYFEVWRLKTSSNSNNNNNENENTETPTLNLGDDEMYIYEVTRKNGKTEIWFMNGLTRWYLPTDEAVATAEAQLKKYGRSTARMRFNHDNYQLKQLEKSAKEIK
ncbi:peptidoglycan amidohydrolase family protein [Enterococcus wangshanyuanii]|uniref:Bacteriophage lysin domain-containing protein n=1 Tax=Enterococcus wangshanyuanii TaxID=2005703 RepID=A0ABQ1NVX2_9ENTE|nr:peptidoglycan amidohydrolase family protein [Enterococcus wangshanyuanii]GGC84197.1 hypothetical protein GCM10011573_12230 [Enterococcus wangshanyuanii]